MIFLSFLSLGWGWYIEHLWPVFIFLLYVLRLFIPMLPVCFTGRRSLEIELKLKQFLSFYTALHQSVCILETEANTCSGQRVVYLERRYRDNSHD